MARTHPRAAIRGLTRKAAQRVTVPIYRRGAAQLARPIQGGRGSSQWSGSENPATPHEITAFFFRGNACTRRRQKPQSRGSLCLCAERRERAKRAGRLSAADCASLLILPAGLLTREFDKDVVKLQFSASRRPTRRVGLQPLQNLPAASQVDPRRLFPRPSARDCPTNGGLTNAAPPEPIDGRRAATEPTDDPACARAAHHTARRHAPSPRPRRDPPFCSSELPHECHTKNAS